MESQEQDRWCGQQVSRGDQKGTVTSVRYTNRDGHAVPTSATFRPENHNGEVKVLWPAKNLKLAAS